MILYLNEDFSEIKKSNIYIFNQEDFRYFNTKFCWSGKSKGDYTIVNVLYVKGNAPPKLKEKIDFYNKSEYKELFNKTKEDWNKIESLLQLSSRKSTTLRMVDATNTHAICLVGHMQIGTIYNLYHREMSSLHPSLYVVPSEFSHLYMTCNENGDYVLKLRDTAEEFVEDLVQANTAGYYMMFHRAIPKNLAWAIFVEVSNEVNRMKHKVISWESLETTGSSLLEKEKTELVH